MDKCHANMVERKYRLTPGNWKGFRKMFRLDLNNKSYLQQYLYFTECLSHTRINVTRQGKGARTGSRRNNGTIKERML